MPCDNIRDGLRPLGLVSNCWKVQLDSGNSLDSLVAEAVRLKLTAIELRQGSLGVYEAGSTCRPQADRLADLARRFPSVKFNVALSLPCLGSALTREDSMFLAGRSAAIALANRERPHLRLVDLQTRPEQCVTSSIETAARGLVELTEAMLEVEGILSIEHSWQPWPWFDSVMNAARRMLGERSAQLATLFRPVQFVADGTIGRYRRHRRVDYPRRRVDDPCQAAQRRTSPVAGRRRRPRLAEALENPATARACRTDVI